jgi:hypothetical protein
MTLLYESQYAVLELDRARHIVRYTRTRVPFPSVEDAVSAFGELARFTAGIDRATHSLLTDLRSAQGRNDEAFESAVAHFRTQLFAGFMRRAILVKTVAGKLQVQRLDREQHLLAQAVFQDEAEALAYLETGALRSAPVARR